MGGRAAAAIGLTVGFYVLVIVVGLGFIALPFLLFKLTDHTNIWLDLASIGVGATVLGSLRETAASPEVNLPGIELRESSAPGLVEQCESVSRDVGQEPPQSYRLTLELNAGVTEVGGGLRSGGRRVVFVGLPLLAILNVSEMKAVIAHEVGHYAGGDTRVEPRIYRARERIGRTIEALSREDKLSMRLARAPFRWYGKAFLRITNVISRRQEFAADAVATRLAGSEPQRSSLRKLAFNTAAYESFWSSEFSPLLSAGKQAPLVEGFHRFLGADAIAASEEGVTRSALEEKTHPYASHPALGERLAAIPVDTNPKPIDETSAVSLLADPDALEDVLVRSVVGKESNQLERVDWSTGPAGVLEASYRAFLDQHDAVTAIGIGAIPAAASRAHALGRELAGASDIDDAHAQAISVSALGSVLAVRLIDKGFRLEAPPGEAIYLIGPDRRVEPFELVGRLVSGTDQIERHELAERLAGLDRLPA